MLLIFEKKYRTEYYLQNQQKSVTLINVDDDNKISDLDFVCKKTKR